MQLFHKNNGKKSLIIFFSGWALDYTPFARLFSNDFFSQSDMLFVWDYRNIDFSFDFSAYEDIKAISFSYGVFMSQFVNLPFLSSNVAFCGTLEPISKEYGINPKMFDLTLKTLSPDTLQKFYRNMFVSEDAYLRFLELNAKTVHDIQALKDELSNIKTLSNKEVPFKKDFTHVFIPTDDRIIPTSSQKKYWEQFLMPECIVGGHFPFLEYSMRKLIK